MAVTTSEVVTFDGVVLNTLAFNISTGTGRTTIPAIRGENTVIPGRSGYIPVFNRPTDAGTAVWKMWIVGADVDGKPPTGITVRNQFWVNREKLLNLFTRRTSLSLATVRQPDGSVRQAKVQVSDLSDFTEMAGRTRAEFSVALQIPDVYWTDLADIQQVSAVGATVPKVLSLTNFAGTQGPIEDSVIRVNGPITNPRVTDAETGNWVQYTGTLGSGATWIVDCAAWTSSVSGSSALAATSHGGHVRFLSISPRYGTSPVPQVVLTGTGGGSGTSFTVTARRKFYNA